MAKKRTVHRLQREYDEKYSHIPNTHAERLEYILSLKKNRSTFMDDVEKAKRRIKRIKWAEYSFTIDMVPQSTQRPRHTFTGRTYVPHAAERADFFENFILPSLENPPKISTPCLVCIDFYEETPKSFNQIRKVLAEEKMLPNVTIRDIDNMLKAVLDFIQHGMLENDNKVYIAEVGKWYSVKPRIDIKIKYLQKDPYSIC